MSLEHLSESKLQVLEGLTTYRYLTAQQVLDLGIYKNITAARDQLLKPMARCHRPFIAFKDFGAELPGKGGKIPFVYCLTARGAQAVADLHRVPVQTIPYPKYGIQFSRDVFHRIATVDCHIRIRQWAEKIGAEVVWADMYFDVIGTQATGGQTKATRINLNDVGTDWIEPDAIFGIRLGQATLIYVFELHRHTDAGRISQQLARHGRALQQHSIRRKYNVSNMPYVLSVYDRKATVNRHAEQMKIGNQTVLRSVRSRVQHWFNGSALEPGFLFNTLEQVKMDISQGWTLADGASEEPFPMPSVE